MELQKGANQSLLSFLLVFLIIPFSTSTPNQSKAWYGANLHHQHLRGNLGADDAGFAHFVKW
jgi:hypothetical protein